MAHDSSDGNGLVPRKGMTLIGSDGEEIGEIDLVEANYVIVKKGLFPQDYYIPISDIVSRAGDNGLRLATPAQEALDRGLGNPAVGAEAGVTDTTPRGDVVVDGDDTDTAPEDAALHADTGEPDDDDMHRTISLAQEEITATTRPVERGVVRVEKQVTEELQTFEVPLVEDEVHVTRRRVDRGINGEDAAFEEKHIEIPLRGQGVEIEKQAHVVEEIEIDKTEHQRIERVTETVRHEEARIEGEDIEIEKDRSDDTPR